MIFRPPSSCRIQISHIQQRANGECLAACAAMACTYSGIKVDYKRLVRMLKIERGLGTPFYQIHNLANLKIKVIYQERGRLEELYQLRYNGWPAIVGVQTNELPYWNHLRVQHAVVIVGLDSTYAYLNDPAFPEAPLQVSLGDFELAWLEQGEVYTVLTP